MNIYLKHILLVATSCSILVTTLFVLSASVDNQELFSRVSFGYPVSFLLQDFSLTDEFLFFPHYFKFSFDFQKYPISGFSFPYFIADFLIIFGIIEVIVFVLEKCKGFFIDRKIWPYSNLN
jgi:hypothetical protein